MMMGMGLGFLGMLLFWGILLVVVIGGVAWTFRQITGTHPSGEQHQPTARQILDERLAQGEIDREQYEAIRARIAG
jgi:putative membrane protein